MRRALPVVMTIALTSPALAQFPPPGVYACVDELGGTVGTLALLPAGDYEFTLPSDGVWEGQIASAGTSVQALTGKLADEYQLEGAFETDARGVTRFGFSSSIGPISCGPAD